MNQSAYLIEMGDFTVTLHKKRIKNMNLRISHTGAVSLSIPLRTSIKTAKDFLDSKLSWIDMHRQRLHQPIEEKPHQLAPGQSIAYLGRQYELIIQPTKTRQSIHLIDDQLHLFIQPDASEARKQHLLDKWYHARMEELLPIFLDKWQSAMQVSIHQVTVRSMKTRWGSCHPIKKHITLNLRLMEKPLPCLEYVIVHELVHLFESGHNARFYALMDKYLPSWRTVKKLLNG